MTDPVRIWYLSGSSDISISSLIRVPSSVIGQLDVICPIIQFSSCSRLVGLSSGVCLAFQISCLDPLEKIDKNKIEAYFTKIDNIEIIHKMQEYSVWLSGLKAEMNKDLSVEDIKQAKASFYSLVYFWGNYVYFWQRKKWWTIRDYLC